MNRKRWAAGIALTVAVGALTYLASKHWFAANENPRANLLRAMPADATAVIYVGVDELRRASVLGKLSNWASPTARDPEYKQFIEETGFNFERDLDRMGVAIENRGTAQSLFVLADGNFNRNKMEAYLKKAGSSQHQGELEIFRLPPGIRERPISLAFLSDRKIALTDGDDLAAAVRTGQTSAGHAEWGERFERLAGTPLFAVMRQDAALGSALSAQAPGGLRSPQLAQLLNQLRWISLAGKPEGDQFRVVAEGECPNETSMRQLADFMNGMAVMAEAGLNDPKLRQQMDPGLREAYLQLLKSLEVAKLDRGESKSVRVVFVVTPEIWEKFSSPAPRALPQAPPAIGESTKGQPKNKTGGTPPPVRKP